MSQLHQHQPDNGTASPLNILVARLHAAPDGIEYVRPLDGVIADGDSTRFLQFEAQLNGTLPPVVALWEMRQGATVGYAKESLYIHADGESKNSLAFLVDGTFATETAQLALISRIGALMLCSRAELAAMPWAQFEALAVEMVQKGVVLVCKGWANETGLSGAFAAHFEEVAACLNHKRPVLLLNGIVQ